ncbi:hypothetical protein M404DRAFT_583017 [Pisolithus tinctorius Marx 270]|uniref:Uncharacterized protein n=1 Tax=Pisolithus tinctorius Marx 270 TaxID=870435 RepID=A0A0C3JWL2_PISTI|nr:hypothetical protein M404DRAFT_583017 [Pisolithus tinctorius Marx 270]
MTLAPDMASRAALLSTKGTLCPVCSSERSSFFLFRVLQIHEIRNTDTRVEEEHSSAPPFGIVRGPPQPLIVKGMDRWAWWLDASSSVRQRLGIIIIRT